MATIITRAGKGSPLTNAEVDANFVNLNTDKLEADTPVVVDAEDPEKLRFNDQSMIVVLVNAIQELKQQFDDYKASHP